MTLFRRDSDAQSVRLIAQSSLGVGALGCPMQ